MKTGTGKRNSGESLTSRIDRFSQPKHLVLAVFAQFLSVLPAKKIKIQLPQFSRRNYLISPILPGILAFFKNKNSVHNRKPTEPKSHLKSYPGGAEFGAYRAYSDLRHMGGVPANILFIAASDDCGM